MSDFDDRLDNRLDDRLRAALGGLGDAAEQQVRLPGAGAAQTAGRRRRRAGFAAGTGLALVLAGGGVTAGWSLARDGGPSGRGEQVAAPGCPPADVSAFLPLPRAGSTDELREQVGAILHSSPEVASFAYESQQEAYRRFKEQFSDAPDLVAATKPESLPASWRFRLRCATDYPAVRARLETLPGVDLVCTCEFTDPDKLTASLVPTR
jgi:hypothetical protein